MRRAHLFILLLTCSCACKKNNDHAAPTCRIERLIKNGTDTYDFMYNTEGKLSSILQLPANEQTIFSYEGNKTIVTINKNGNFKNRMIIDNNASGLATNVRIEYNLSGSQWFNQRFLYDGTQCTGNVVSNQANDSATASYIWENGNPTVLLSDGDVFNYKYYAGKAYQAGDWRYIQQLTSGYWIYRYANLVQSQDIAGFITYYTYVFDENGRITEAKSTNTNSTTTFKIAYECD